MLQVLQVARQSILMASQSQVEKALHSTLQMARQLTWVSRLTPLIFQHAHRVNLQMETSSSETRPGMDPSSLSVRFFCNPFLLYGKLIFTLQQAVMISPVSGSSDWHLSCMLTTIFSSQRKWPYLWRWRTILLGKFTPKDAILPRVCWKKCHRMV